MAAGEAIGSAIAIASSHRRFQRSTAAEVQTVFREGEAALGSADLKARRDQLPPPIQRHLTYAITSNAPSIRTARLRHDGTFRTGPDRRWLPITGEQYFSVGHPGFVWFASLRLAPFLWIQARDRLVSGKGNMLVKPLSAFALADASGPEIDQGSALRWLAESVWFPYALAGPDVQWEAIDDRSARATLRGGGLPVQATFETGADGRLASVHAERYRDTGGGQSVPTPWSGQ